MPTKRVVTSIGALVAAVTLCGVTTSANSSLVAINLDGSTFFRDQSVSVSLDGKSATLSEDLGIPIGTPVLLSNDPTQGDPNVIVAEAGTTLRLSYDFKEAAGETDSFRIAVLDLTAQLEYSTILTSSESGSVAFDLSALVGHTLGLEFGLTRLTGDTGLLSTAMVSNVVLDKLDPAPVPEPSTYLLLGLGLIALVGVGRFRRRAIDAT